MALPLFALALGGASMLSSIFGAKGAKKDAKRQKRLMQQLAAIQARQQHIESQRAARIRSASLIGARAAQGGGASSVIESALVGLQTQARTQQDITGQQLAIQQRQYDIQADQQIDAANASIGGAIGSFAATVTAPTGSSGQGRSLVEQGFDFDF
jgi:hypothetical protein